MPKAITNKHSGFICTRTFFCLPLWLNFGARRFPLCWHTEINYSKELHILSCHKNMLAHWRRFFIFVSSEKLAESESWERSEALKNESRLPDDVFWWWKRYKSSESTIISLSKCSVICRSGLFFSFVGVLKRWVMQKKNLIINVKSFFLFCLPRMKNCLSLFFPALPDAKKNMRMSTISRDNFIYVGCSAWLHSWKCLTSEKQ